MGGTDGCGEGIVAGGRARSVELDSAILEHLPPSVQFFAHESLEFLRRAAHRADTGFLEFVGDDRIGIHLDDLALNLVDDSAWRAGGRHEPNPGRDIVERSEEHTSELLSRPHLVCRLLLEKKK